MAGAFIIVQVFFPEERTSFRTYTCFTPFTLQHLRRLISDEQSVPIDNIQLTYHMNTLSDSYRIKENETYHCVIRRPELSHFVAFYFKNNIHLLDITSRQIHPLQPFIHSSPFVVYIDDSTFSSHAIHVLSTRHLLHSSTKTQIIHDLLQQIYHISHSIQPIHKASISVISEYQQFVHDTFNTSSDDINMDIEDEDEEYFDSMDGDGEWN